MGTPGQAAPSRPGDQDRAGSAASAVGVPGRKALRTEVWIVLGLSLLASGAYAALDLARALTAAAPLRRQTAVLSAPVAPGHPTLDLAYQLLGVAVTLVPVALVVHLLGRSGESAARIGLDAGRPWRDAAEGAVLALLIGGAGLGLYLGIFEAGLSLKVVPTTLPAVWWRIPVLVLQAAQNGILEEVIVTGYLLHRLSQLGWRDSRALGTSAVLRGTYHLYQGFGGFLGNFLMGLVFGRIYQRWGRVTPLVIAHTLLDTGAFVGWVTLHSKVGWLP